MLKFITFIDGTTKESFTNWWSIFIWNIRLFQDKEFRIETSCLQLLRKSLFSYTLFFLYFSFSFFRKSLTVKFPCFRPILLYIFIIFFESTKLKIAWKRITTFFKEAFQPYYDRFQVNWLVQNYWYLYKS